MPSIVPAQDGDIILKFGGGLHSRASEDEIDPREAKDGQNFKLDVENRELRNRAPFDLVGTAPNAGSVNGFISLLQSDGTVKLAVQAADKVYDFDGASTFTQIGTVSSSAKLRGRLEHNWQLADKVLITDLALVEQIIEWDGSTFQDVAFTDENDAAFGDFSARYCVIANERAIFGHIKEPSGSFPHMIVGCKRGDYTNITVSNRASSALNAEDPFFLLTPDLYPLNGLLRAFDVTLMSSKNGSIFKLTGSGSDDFAIDSFYPRSAASGDEAVVFVRNDVIYGRPGRVESLVATQKFGDVAANDISRPVADLLASYDDWTVVYNARLDRVYLIPGGSVGEMWVLYKDLLDAGELSPWSLWTTQHALSFQPTAIMNALDPVDGLEYVFMGDSSGNVYRLEGVGLNGDGGSASIQMEWLSGLATIPLGAQAYQVEGWIKYRKSAAASVTLRFEFAGESVFNEEITIGIPAAAGEPVWGGDVFWGGDFYFGTAFARRLTRQKFGVAGQSNDFQVRVIVDDTDPIEVNEIGLRFSASSV